MSSHEPPSDLDQLLVDAFQRRHAASASLRPSLVDVRRRARRRSSSRAAARVGGVVAAGATVVGGAWIAGARGDEPSPSPVAAHGADSSPPPTTYVSYQVIDVTVDVLWQALADEYGTTVEQLRADNPSVDFSQPPAPGTQLSFQQVPDAGVPPTTVGVDPPSSEGASVPPTTMPVPDVTYVAEVPTSTSPTSTMAVPDPTVRSPDLQQGERLYQVVTGDYMVAIADRFCTTVDDLVARNDWVDVDSAVLFPGDLIAVPADAC
jgi:LysM repeat protein